MAMLATRSHHPGPLGGGPGATYRTTGLSGSTAVGVFASPTESEFSESYDVVDTVRSWDEARVGDWLKSINLPQYVDLFQRHNINGENLTDLDQSTLKELGVTKVGDRVRINSQVKIFRNSAARRASKRTINRNSLAVLDNTSSLPPTSASPRGLHSARGAGTSRADKRLSRHYDASALSSATGPSSRPGSPMIDPDSRSVRSQKHGVMSPLDSGKKDPNSSYFSTGSSKSGQKQSETPQTARFPSHVKGSPSLDNLAAYNTALPVDKPLIRVVFDNGRSSVVNITGCKTVDDIICITLRKGLLNEAHYKSYCFYLLDGSDPNPVHCRRLGDSELLRIISDRVRSERGRLILRKIHAGEPGSEQLRIAAKLAENDPPSPPAIEVHQPGKSRSQMKVEKLIGESLPLPSVTYPMSPASEYKTKAYFEGSLKRTESSSTSASARARKLKDFYGQRPPTELITQDLTSYFPDVEKEKMDRTVRMSIRRSQRLSRAANRMSVASNFSFASSFKDAPPLPTIADSWLQGSNQKPLRPLSVVRLGRPESDYRQSVALSVLEPLNEDSAFEPSRKSYVSFGEGSGSDSNSAHHNHPTTTDEDGNTIMRSYFDDSGAVGDSGESLNSRLSRFIAEDSEEDDEELMEHLEQDSWENLKYMKGAMIGQGSFGTVYLALHAITGELMALKQVEMPSSNNTAIDAKKNNMVEALKREIDLLRELKHANIVQYLGSNSDDTHLNIFLEYVAGGSVATMLVNYGSLPEALISNFVRQILHGLAYLHSKDIIHRDIKGANILVDNHGSVKISDFGISKRVESTLRTSVAHPKGRAGPRVSLQGSVFWMAPEVVKQTAYTRKADIWSLGCLIVEMMTGSHPHPNCTQLQAIFKIGGSGEARPDIPESASKEVRHFLERTFEIEHEKRPTADELLTFAFVEDKNVKA
ncbi:MAP kinase-like protein [Myriangium duriaei CBS 260.36]|uniref:mitogen-activated protein kinase kinase kinase n=1 Tax=Myriangium duriaei CBS 260.36 TaxID=1168546 RepID=A0A9P4J6G9_9PEZI|nr:MAP kinase-like protein [Myriangium duriaei CBS 260.36]